MQEPLGASNLGVTSEDHLLREDGGGKDKLRGEMLEGERKYRMCVEQGLGEGDKGLKIIKLWDLGEGKNGAGWGWRT